MLPARPRLSLLLENFGLLFVFTRSLRTRERNGISARIHPQSIATSSLIYAATAALAVAGVTLVATAGTILARRLTRKRR